MDSTEAYFDDDGWKQQTRRARKTVRKLTSHTHANDLFVILDLQTMKLDETFQYQFLKDNIIDAVEQVTNKIYTCSQINVYLMSDTKESEEHRRNVEFLKKFCNLVDCYTRKLRCHVCKSLPTEGRKKRLSELEMVKDSCDVALEERNNRMKTAFFIASNDQFFNDVLAQDLASQGFEVFTGRVKGMVRKSMYRSVV
ncbi:unnamed protein product [Arabis nemorensis]|uniref:NYN domain-containing protein n=1 Tax=Arabis nemorensis TaxID=586526 RepID=A0A565BEV9_9BRAS|nr:unnamed protein product [Arabis nemorensis]